MRNTHGSSNSKRSKASGGEFYDWDINKIREVLQILKDHQEKCEEEGKFAEAQLAQERYDQVKKIEEQKSLADFAQMREDEIITLENNSNEAIILFNARKDAEFMKLSDQLEAEEKELQLKHEGEIAMYTEKYIEKHPANPTPNFSKEYLDTVKVLEGVIKQKDYAYAHKLQQKLTKMTNDEHRRAEENRIKKLDSDISKMKLKHSNEMQNLLLKNNKRFTEFKKNRAIEFELLLQSSRNKQGKMQTTHTRLLNEFKNPSTAKARNLLKEGGSTMGSKQGSRISYKNKEESGVF